MNLLVFFCQLNTICFHTCAVFFLIQINYSSNVEGENALEGLVGDTKWTN